MLNLHATASRATIEHCTETRFAAAPASLLTPAPLEGAAEVKKLPVVQDFDHPGAGRTPSPSWSVLEDGARESIQRLFDTIGKSQEEVESALGEVGRFVGWDI